MIKKRLNPDSTILLQDQFTEDDDYLDWRFAKEAIGGLKKQKRELEYA